MGRDAAASVLADRMTTDDLVLRTLLEIKEDVGGLRSGMDGIAAAQTDHGARLVKVEGKVNSILGWASGAGAAAGGVVALVKAKLGMGE